MNVVAVFSGPAGGYPCTNIFFFELFWGVENSQAYSVFIGVGFLLFLVFLLLGFECA